MSNKWFHHSNKMKVSVFTLGCKTNLYESSQIVAALNKAGHQASHGLEQADLFVLNTCAITKEAERKSRQLVTRARKLNPQCKVVVVGCAAQKNSEEFCRLQNVTLIKGVADKTALVRQLEEVGKNIEALPCVYAEEGFAAQQRTRAFVKIQDGCNNFCSYCIVPYLRGRSRSRKICHIVQEVNAANSAETVLIGIDISQFGKDTGESLPMLAEALQGANTRIRLGSLETGVVTDKMLQSFAKTNFCPHFHLSLQSGCDTVLARMNRKYTTAQFLQAVEKIRKVFPDAAVTTDIIVGFCGETEEEFAQTCAFVDKVQFADIHVFPYSPREGTVAFGWQDTPSQIKTERAQVLAAKKAQLKLAFAQKFCGKVCNVLCELNKNGVWEGYTEQYLRVYFKGHCHEGQVAKVQIEQPFADGSKGKLV